MIGHNDATLAQIRAANPKSSTWVSANAGSGKTRVLTDRVARLLLAETPPQKILCLTYTKAAASHMQIQLFERLGKWAMLPDAELRASLTDLGEEADKITPQGLRMARTLFARALETPGGLKIQTIHSFCAALLRRFPLEAGVSPQFQEMDERSDRKLRADILESLADQDDPLAFDAVAAHLSGDDVDKLASEVAKQRDAFVSVRSKAGIWRAFGLADGFSEQDYLAQVFPDWAAEVLADLGKALLTGSPNDLRDAGKLAKLDLTNLNLEAAEIVEDIFVFGHSTASPNTAKLSRFPTGPTRKAFPDLTEAVQALMLGFEAAKPLRQGLKAAQKCHALHQFATAFLPEYAARKQAHGWLDFDDLILKARALLTESGMAQWVLFKMDGGIDHILVDEAQDTSPAQWAVISTLAEEFSTGFGARDVERTIFVVGDEKQSIYSFQGADPHAFDEMRQHFSTRLQAAGSTLEPHELAFSFRSSPTILRLVDQVMQSAKSDLSGTVTHRAFHGKLPGRVDLWPFLEKPEKEERPEWFDPVDAPGADNPALILAGKIAEAIKKILDDETTISTTRGDRRVQPGDFLILVQRRSTLFHEMIKALKNANLPVAGADRLRVGAELAVRDLTAVLAFLATPEDDLSLACALRSPLLGFSENDLYHLAYGRKGWLWAILRDRAADYPDTLQLLNDLRDQTDFLRPYELLERILIRHKGRENLIARLGHEAEEGIDALLAQAMEYERMEAPSLTGFLGWMSTDDSDIKRQMDAKSRQIRVMTVHGAKGLESPIVILPDTAHRNLQLRNNLLMVPDALVSWKLPESDAPAPMLAAIEAAKTDAAEERLRLLYVAMTRAENWLIICGAGDRGKELQSWYNRMEQAVGELPSVAHTFPTGQGKRYEAETWPRTPSDAAATDQPAAIDLPVWANQAAPAAPHPATPIKPSDLGGAKIMADSTEGLDEAAAKLRGSQIHALLEHLPDIPAPARLNAATRILRGQSAAVIDDLLTEVAPILDDPAFAALFAPDTLAEVTISSTLNGQPMFGVIDRLVVTPDRILAVDFKSNAEVPQSAAETPEGILRQMAAYRAGLAEIWPDRDIVTAVLWTRTGILMELPHQIVTDALGRITLS